MQANGQSNLTQDRIAAADGRFNCSRHVTPTCPPMWAHWRHLASSGIRLNLWFLRPTQVHDPSGKAIGSAVFAQLTADTLQWDTASPSKLPLPMGDLDPI